MLSIIIVSYNVPELLIRCIESIKACRDADDIEIVVVDNDSTDNAFDIIQIRFPNVVWVQNRHNLGFATAVNIGLRAASGDYILLINPDSEIDSGAFKEIRDFWIKHPDGGILGGKVITPDGTFQKQCCRCFPNPMNAFFRLFGLASVFPKHKLAAAYELDFSNVSVPREIEAVSGAFMSFPKKLTWEIGMFDEGYFLMGEDLDFCYRASKAGKRVYYLPGALLTHHHGACRRTRPIRSLYYGHLAMIRYFRKFLRHEYSRTVAITVYFGVLIHFASVELVTILGGILIEKN